MDLANLFSAIWSSTPVDVKNTSFLSFTILLISSILLSLLISNLYRQYFDSNSTGSNIHRSFPLIAPAVTTIFVTVQYSLPLSLGLLGALSIVRFRTPIKEPEEIGFIMLVIASSLSIATFNLVFAVLLYLVVYLTLFIRSKTNLGAAAFEKSSSVLSVALQDEKLGNADAINQVKEYLNKEKIPTKVLSCQINETVLTASLILKIQNDDIFKVLENLSSKFPHGKFDIYSR